MHSTPVISPASIKAAQPVILLFQQRLPFYSDSYDECETETLTLAHTQEYDKLESPLKTYMGKNDVEKKSKNAKLQ